MKNKSFDKIILMFIFCTITIILSHKHAVALDNTDPLRCIIDGIIACPLTNDAAKRMHYMKGVYKECANTKEINLCIVDGMATCSFVDKRQEIEDCMDEYYIACLQNNGEL